MGVKQNCYWYRELHVTKQSWCNALECLQCENGECSFYETTEQYKKRQMDFAEKQASKSKK